MATGRSVVLRLPHPASFPRCDVSPKRRARPPGILHLLVGSTAGPKDQIDDRGRAVEFNIADLFESVVDRVGTQTAMVSGARRLSYSELDHRANRLAHHLDHVGVGPGDHVGLQLANGTEYIEGMLACFKIRAVPINVNYRYTAGELQYLYKDAALVGLIFHSRFAPAVSGALGAMSDTRAVLEVPDGSGSSGIAGDYEVALESGPLTRGFPTRRASDLYCVYTGGTTGMPKGVLWRHDDIFFAAMGGGDPLSLGNHITFPEELADRVLHPGITALAIPPFMHSAGHWLAFSILFGGGKVVMIEGGAFDASEVWRLVEAEAVNAVVVVGDAMACPLLDQLAVDPDRYDLSSLMAVGSGGAVLSPSTKAQLAQLLPGRVVADRFGSSETGQVGGQAPAEDSFGPPRLRVDTCTEVLDAELEAVTPGSGVIGHLARGGHIPIGYLGDSAKSAATFVEHRGRRWALPGDLATVQADGTIIVLGRGSLCINTGGEKVFPDEVEAALKDNPDIRDVIVIGMPDVRFGERVVALVQPRPGHRVDLDMLRQHGRDRLAGYKVPREIILVDEITRSPSGKPDYPWALSVAESASGREKGA
jgi:3-oxocholest-4-en-26-oate---CoA ligase